MAVEVTDELLSRVAEVVQRATPGPWEYSEANGDSYISAPTAPLDERSLMCDTSYYPWTPNRNTMRYIATLSPDVALALVAEIAVLQRALEMASTEVCGGFVSKDFVDYWIAAARAERSKA